jgi:hypothetical protein
MAIMGFGGGAMIGAPLADRLMHHLAGPDSVGVWETLLVLAAVASVLLLSMYGGGFAAIPAYLADLFGTGSVGAIHGRLLTAWSVAGILGPVLVNYVNESQLAAGTPPAQAYDRTMLLLAGLLAVGLVCNLAIRAPRSPERAADIGPSPALNETPAAAALAPTAGWPWVAAFWLLVTLPLAWGMGQTLRQAAALVR